MRANVWMVRVGALGGLLWALWIGALWAGVGAEVRADGSTEFLIRMLATSDQFRVRAQAALALGMRPPEPASIQALGRALRDDHPAVRSASAGALELLRDPTALAALRAARRERDPAARAAIEHAIGALERLAAAPARVPASTPEPSGHATYYVAIGTPSTQAGLPANSLRDLREHMLKQVAMIDGVRIAPENENPATAANLIRSKKLVGYYLDSAVTKIEPKPDGALRAQVSIIVGTYPGRAMRVMLSGAATVSGSGSSERAKLEATEAAFTGALRRLPQAMEAGLARAD